MGENRPVKPPYSLALLTDPPTWRGTALSGRPLDLLAVLAASPQTRVSDDILIAALWPARVRAVVGEGVVERLGDGYRLALPAAQIDVCDLADRAERARTRAVEGQWDQVLVLTGSLPQVPAHCEAGDAVGAGPAPLSRLRERAVALAEAARCDRGLALEATG